MQFRIEYVSSRGSPVYVLARQLTDGNFILSETPSLSDVPISRHVDQPRKLKSDGALDVTAFAFRLVSPTDAARFFVGQVVELS
jgi:hypothetical protein